MKTYHYQMSNGEVSGPWSLHQMIDLKQRRKLRPNMLVFREGDTEWRQMRHYPELDLEQRGDAIPPAWRQMPATCMSNPGHAARSQVQWTAAGVLIAIIVGFPLMMARCEPTVSSTRSATVSTRASMSETAFEKGFNAGREAGAVAVVEGRGVPRKLALQLAAVTAAEQAMTLKSEQDSYARGFLAGYEDAHKRFGGLAF